MVRIQGNDLTFSFPEVHPDAHMSISFMRTLRIPDDGNNYPLPPGLDEFPLRDVNDYAGRLPADMVERGGVMMPMYQAEALWLNFDSPADYPFAVLIAAGRINAVSGEKWSDRLRKRPQSYVAVPDQPWLDGYSVGEGVIRQFVAMPLGAGYTAEEQITGEASHGGIQIMVVPLRPELYEPMPDIRFSRKAVCECAPPSMGLAPGGTMKQEVYRDSWRIRDYHPTARSRCFVHLLNSVTWLDTTGEAPPQRPITAADYSRAGLPWFDWYSDLHALSGSPRLAALKSAQEMARQKRTPEVPEDDVSVPLPVVTMKAHAEKAVSEWPGV